jgi:hypothetical protein
MAEQWSYYIHVVKNPQVLGLQRTLRTRGEDGWELVTSLTTVKTMLNLSGNDLLFVFKKPGVGHVAPAQVTGVSADPLDFQ